MALRVDKGTLRPAKKLDDGRVIADAFITRAGVFEYLDERGNVRRELREPSEVFDPRSLESFAQVPVTNAHPHERVTADNARQYMIGASGERVERDDDHVRASLMIADSDTLDEMRRQRKYDVSCGYTCDVVEGKGVHPVYGEYDARQTNIRGNHIAVNLHRGRAGTARVRMDAAELARRAIERAVAVSKASNRTTSRVRMDGAAVMVQDDDEQPTRQRGRSMPPVNKPKTTDKTDAAEQKKLLDAAADELAKAEQRADAAEDALDKEVKRADAAEGRVASLEAEVKALKEGRLDEAELRKRDTEIETLKRKLAKLQSRVDEAESPERFSKGVARRVKILGAAGPILGERVVTDSATDFELMCAVVEKLHGVDIRKDDDGNERSIDYVTARFDAAIEGWSEGENTLDRLREMTRGRSVEAPREDAASARAKYVHRQQTAWNPNASKA